MLRGIQVQERRASAEDYDVAIGIPMVLSTEITSVAFCRQTGSGDVVTIEQAYENIPHDKRIRLEALLEEIEDAAFESVFGG
jgi:hypothetical protein